jgi:RimJ/RimL family protein N-acetyltransferase
MAPRYLEGEKCYLAPIDADDIETYTRWINDFDTGLMLRKTQGVVSEAAERKILDTLAEKESDFGIRDKATDELIGGCGLKDVDLVNRTAMLGIFIGEVEYRGHGYGADAIHLLLSHGFHILGLESLSLEVFSYNEAAIALYRKVGFREIGRRRRARRIGNRAFDVILFDMLNEEFDGGPVTRKVRDLP